MGGVMNAESETALAQGQDSKRASFRATREAEARVLLLIDGFSRKTTAPRFFSKAAKPKSSSGKCGRSGPRARKGRDGTGQAHPDDTDVELIC